MVSLVLTILPQYLMYLDFSKTLSETFMNATINWINRMKFIGESDTGHIVPIDASVKFGGDNLAPTPMEMVLIGLGGCTAMDVVKILKKSRQMIEDCTVQLKAEQHSEPPTVFTKIHLHYVITGRNISLDHVVKAIDLSGEKFCSVSKMIEHTARITRDF